MQHEQQYSVTIISQTFMSETSQIINNNYFKREISGFLHHCHRFLSFLSQRTDDQLRLSYGRRMYDGIDIPTLILQNKAIMDRVEYLLDLKEECTFLCIFIFIFSLIFF